MYIQINSALGGVLTLEKLIEARKILIQRSPIDGYATPIAKPEFIAEHRRKILRKGYAKKNK